MSSHFHHLSHHTPLSLSENTSVIVVLWVGFVSSFESNAAKLLCRAKLICSREVVQESYLSYCVSFVPTLFCYTNLYTLFRVADEGIIMALLRRISSCRRQHIIQERDLGTLQYLRACMPQWQASSLSTVSSHHWLLIERFH